MLCKQAFLAFILTTFLVVPLVDNKGVVNLSYASAVVDCRTVTPLPSDAEVIKPGPNVPEEFARAPHWHLSRSDASHLRGGWKQGHPAPGVWFVPDD